MSTSSRADGPAIFMMAQEKGGLNPSFSVARSLKQRGRSVLYVGLPELKGHVEAQGFRFVSLDFAVDEIERLVAERKLRELARVFDTVIDAVRETIRREAPSVGLVEPYCSWFWLAARLEGLPLLSLCPNYSYFFNSQVPPYSSSSIPGQGLTSRIVNVAQWALLNGWRQLEKWRGTIGGYAHFERLARRYGYPCAAGEPRPGPRALLPEVVLAPRALDFANRLGRRYAGLCVDLERKEAELSPDLSEGDAPIVYCSLGTLSELYPERDAFLRKVINVFNSRRELRLVLHTGGARPDELPDMGSNITASPQVPQLAVLRRAAVFITHAGLGSVKEAIAFSVPMFAVPCWHDQPGNAARVVAKGLGLRASIARVSEREIDAGVRELYTDHRYRDRVRELRAQIAHEERSDEVARALDNLTRAPAATRESWAHA